MESSDSHKSSPWSALQSPLALVVVALLALFGLRVPQSQPAGSKSAPTSTVSQPEVMAETAETEASVLKTPPLALLREYLQVRRPAPAVAAADRKTTANVDLSPPGASVKSTLTLKHDPPAASEKGHDQLLEPAIVRAIHELRKERDLPEMQCLIATIPDPIDSRFQLICDETIDAIARGVAAHGYDLDRHQFLWADELKQAAQSKTLITATRRSRREPSAMLFRKQRDSARNSSEHDFSELERLEGDVNTLLMVLLVGETPTAGVHKEALAAALDFVDAWRITGSARKPASSDLHVHVLGPEFSGSATSLRYGICEWWEQRCAAASDLWGLEVRIISGSATSDSNFGILNYAASASKGRGRIQLTFNATVVPDDTTRLELLRHLIRDRRIPLEKIAWLSETATSYGRVKMGSPPPRHTESPEKRKDALNAGATGFRTLEDLFELVAPARAGNGQVRADAANAFQSLEKIVDDPLRPTSAERAPQHDAARRIYIALSDYETQLASRNLQVSGAEGETLFLANYRRLRFLSGRRVQFLDFLQDLGIDLPDLGKQRWLTYPLGLSRIRSEYQKSEAYQAEQANQPTPKPRKNLELSLGQVRHATDVLPTFSDVTTPTTDVTLEQILATIARDDIRAVGLVGTDVLDKLFLAQQIRAHAPDVLIFTQESDVLYLHADYATHLNGTLIASAYPLFTRSRGWTGAGRNEKDLFFTADTTQGVYNATVALLNEPSRPNSNPQLIDYSPLFAGGELRRPGQDGPSVWLTTIGETGMWPVGVIPLNDGKHEGADTYVFHARPPGESQDKKNRTSFQVHAPSLVPFLTSTTFVLLAVAAYLFANWPVGLRFRKVEQLWRHIGRLAPWLRVSDTCVSQEQLVHITSSGQEMLAMVRHFEPRRSVRACLSLALLGCVTLWYLLIASPFLVLAAWLGVRVRRQPPASIEVLPAGIVRLLLVVAVSGLSLSLLLWAIHRTVPHVRGWWVWLVRILGPAALVAGACLVLSIGFDDARAMVFVERAGAYGSGASPLFPLGALCVALALWATCHLRREYFLHIYPLVTPFPDDAGQTTRSHLAGIKSRFVELKGRLYHRFQWPKAPTDWIVGILLALGACYVLWSGWVGTAEGGIFDGFYRFALMLTLTAYYGLLVRMKAVCGLFERLLRRLGQHAMVDAYERVPARLAAKASGQIFASAPHPGDLDQPVRCLHMLAKSGQGRWPSGLAFAEMAEAKFCRILNCDREHKPLAKRLAGQLNGLFARIARDQLVGRLLKYWDEAPVQREKKEDKERPEGQQPRSRDAWCEEAEVFVAMHCVNLIRQVFAHIQNLMSLLIAMLLCILISLQGYPFQPRSSLLTLWFGLMVWTVLVIVISLVKFNRNEVLSRISNTVPNQFTWDRSMVLPLLTYVVTPVVGILWVWFPVVGRILFGWLGAIGQWPGT